jgi:hypothetical protein
MSLALESGVACASAATFKELEAMFRTAAVVALMISFSGLPAFAADGEAERGRASSTSAAEPAAADAAAAVEARRLQPVHFGPAARPGALAGLYVSLAGLQAFDAYTTSRGLAGGAREANPLMQGAVNNPAMFWTLKAATTAVPMIMAERMWKKNRVKAIVAMAVANGVAVAVAANNARVLGRQR